MLTLETAQILLAAPPATDSTTQEFVNSNEANVETANESEKWCVFDDGKRNILNEYIDHHDSSPEADTTTQELIDTETTNVESNIIYQSE